MYYANDIINPIDDDFLLPISVEQKCWLNINSNYSPTFLVEYMYIGKPQSQIVMKLKLDYTFNIFILKEVVSND